MAVDVQSYLIGHLGIVAGVFDSLNIAGVIDRSLPKEPSKSSPLSCDQSYDPQRFGIHTPAVVSFS